MLPIFTRYRGPTEVLGSRVIAYEEGGRRVTVPFDHALSSEQMHREALRTFCRKYNLDGTLVEGDTETGRVFVWLDCGGHKYEGSIVNIHPVKGGDADA
jgi:hypothetical protein